MIIIIYIFTNLEKKLTWWVHSKFTIFVWNAISTNKSINGKLLNRYSNLSRFFHYLFSAMSRGDHGSRRKACLHGQRRDWLNTVLRGAYISDRFSVLCYRDSSLIWRQLIVTVYGLWLLQTLYVCVSVCVCLALAANCSETNEPILMRFLLLNLVLSPIVCVK